MRRASPLARAWITWFVGRGNWAYLAAAVAILVLSVGGLLVYSDFIPYVTDGNESFSTYIHAKNMKEFGFGSSMGLTDEANPPHVRAHPYVYTHQGNFPRLASWILMLLGVEKIEWHIGLISLTVGLASVWLCFQFFARAGDRLLAFLVCLVFWTDYLLFVQWQANTFRVWHAFFLFGCLLFVQASTRENRRMMAGFLAAMAFFMFYFEIVFAAFVLLIAAIYGIMLHRRQMSVALWTVGGCVIGGLAGAGMLVVQVTLFLGVDKALQDFRLTFIARNFATVGGLEQRLETLDFFLRNRLLYWDNVFEGSGASRILAVFATLGRYFLEVYTPFLVLVSVVLGSAILLRQWGGWGETGGEAKPIIGHPGWKWLVIAGVSYVLVSLVSKKEGMVGFPEGAAAPLTPPKVLLSLMMALVISKVATGGWLGAARITGVRIALLALHTAFVGTFMVNHRYLYAPHRAPLWLDHIQNYFGDNVLRLILLAVFLVSSSLILRGFDRAREGEQKQVVGAVLRYLFAGAGAFALVCVPLAGYVISGYIIRYAPLPVFLADVGLALVAYVLIRGLRSAVEAWKIRGLGAWGGAVATSLVLVFLGAYWARVQYTYAETLSPRSLLFMKRLAEKPYRGTPFVSDNYTLPIVYYTRSWAFQDHEIQMNQIARGEDGWALEVSGKYMWFADRDVNPEYLRPRYYLCRINPDLDMVARYVSLRPGDRLDNCSREVLFRAAHDSERFRPVYRVMDYDRSPVDGWNVVELRPGVRLVPLELRPRRQLAIVRELSQALGVPIEAMRGRPNVLMIHAQPGEVNFSRVGQVHTDLGYGVGLTLADGIRIWLRYTPFSLADYFSSFFGVRIDSAPGEIDQYLIRAPLGSVDLSRVGVVHSDFGYAVGLTLPDGVQIGFRYEPPAMERIGR